MRLYLSSYRVGNEPQQLKGLVPRGAIGYIANALDFSAADPDRRARHIEDDVAQLRALDLDVELIDLRDHFGGRGDLEKTLLRLGAVYVSGGNVFVLRQAMKLSGLDDLLVGLQGDGDFLYSGYSAAGCVLAPHLKAYAIVDPPETPYPELTEVIWRGLGLVDFAFMPHWQSDHPESADIDREIAYCQQNGIAYRAVRDGEAIIIV